MEVNDKNIEVFANLAINSTQCESQRIQIPRLTYLAQIFSMLSECELSLKITILDESTTVPLINNAWLDVPINIVGNFAQFDLIVDKFNTQSKLHLLIASFMDRSNLPVDLKDILIVHRPEQNVTIMFDFTDAIAIAAGCEKCLNKEVQITNSSSRIMNITQKNSSNFFWRDHRLYCILPLSEQFSMRIRFATALGWSPWSESLLFTCRRKR